MFLPVIFVFMLLKVKHDNNHKNSGYEQTVSVILDNGSCGQIF